MAQYVVSVISGRAQPDKLPGSYTKNDLTFLYSFCFNTANWISTNYKSTSKPK